MSTNKTPTHYYKKPGDYLITISVKDSNQQTTTGNTTVTITDDWDFDMQILCGFGIQVKIINPLEVTVTNVQIDISINSRSGITPNHTNVTISSIEPKGSEIVKMFPVPLGVGRAVVTATAVDDANHLGRVVKKVRFIFVFTAPLLIQ